jgi:hypothetical protein
MCTTATLSSCSLRASEERVRPRQPERGEDGQKGAREAKENSQKGSVVNASPIAQSRTTDTRRLERCRWKNGVAAAERRAPALVARSSARAEKGTVEACPLVAFDSTSTV